MNDQDYLREILAVQREQLAVLKEIRDDARGAAKRPANGSAKPKPAAALGGEVASDADLDGKYGNPEIRKDPPRWDGESFAGRPMSMCSPEFLDAFAAFSDWKADRPREGDDPKWSTYARKDARLARGWAARIRRGDATPKRGAAEYGGGGGGGFVDAAPDGMEDIPFITSAPNAWGL